MHILLLQLLGQHLLQHLQLLHLLKLQRETRGCQVLLQQQALLLLLSLQVGSQL